MIRHPGISLSASGPMNFFARKNYRIFLTILVHSVKIKKRVGCCPHESIFSGKEENHAHI